MKPFEVFFFLFTVRFPLHLINQNQAIFWIYFGSRNIFIGRFQEAARDSCGPLYVREGAVLVPVIAEASSALNMWGRLDSSGKLPQALGLVLP